MDWLTVDLDKLELKNMQDGKDWLEDIYKLYTTTLQQMKETTSNAVYKQLQNDSYRLKQCKIKVQSLMAKKFAADRAKTGNKNRMYV